MRLFGSYLRTHLRGAAVFFLFSLVFAAVFALYHLPVQAVLYAVAVCALLGAVLLAVGFYRFARRHRALLRLREEILLTDEHLPKPMGRIEADYDALVRTLYDEKKRAAEASEARFTEQTEYYTVWAHQIKTPIAAMRLLVSEEDTQRNRELSDQLQNIERYVEMALGYVRLDSESSDFLIRRYDLDTMLCGVIRRYASGFIRKKIRLCYEPVHKTVLTDEKWFSFVLDQLFSNALKYTKTGSVTVSVEEPLTLVIADTGIGIAKEDLPRVFEKGYTGSNGRTDQRATGIGLYLSKRILTKLGHRITVTSEVGVGTEVRIGLDSVTLDFE